jgi:superfamily II DNA helicase RecQ
MLEGRQDIVAMLVPDSRKSLLIMISALPLSALVMIVIVPFIALRDDMRARCRSVRLQTQVWKHGIVFTAFLMLVTPEVVVSSEFQTYLQKLMQERRPRAPDV